MEDLNKKTKIGILIPSISKGIPNCVDYKTTYFYSIFLKSFIKTSCKHFNYVIYLVVDDDDPIYSDAVQREKLESFIFLVKNIELKIISSNGISKGHVTQMWNRAFETAYKEDCVYFYQCGDDIEFMDSGWVSNCVEILQNNNEIGVTGPLDWGREMFKRKHNPNQKLLLTQTFVSRKHFEFFGFYYPSEIINWWCDDWITLVYSRLGLLFVITEYRVINRGGKPRYEPIGAGPRVAEMSGICDALVDKYKGNIKSS